MKKIFGALLIMSLNTLASAQTVLELYKEIPGELLGVLSNPDEPMNKTPEQKESFLTIRDIKNGFLETKGNVQIVKFTRPTGSPLLAVAGSSYADSGRKQRLQFFAKDKSDKWVEVTQEIFSEIPDMVIDALHQKKCRSKTLLSDSASGTYRFILPRVGKRIRAVVESDTAPPCKEDLFTLEFKELRLMMTI